MSSERNDETQMKWISLKDKYPPMDGRYLVYESRYGWVGVSSVRHGKWDDSTITHYMLLPNAPCPENTLPELEWPGVEK